MTVKLLTLLVSLIIIYILITIDKVSLPKFDERVIEVSHLDKEHDDISRTFIDAWSNEINDEIREGQSSSGSRPSPTEERAWGRVRRLDPQNWVAPRTDPTDSPSEPAELIGYDDVNYETVETQEFEYDGSTDTLEIENINTDPSPMTTSNVTYTPSYMATCMADTIRIAMSRDILPVEFIDTHRNIIDVMTKVDRVERNQLLRESFESMSEFNEELSQFKNELFSSAQLSNGISEIMLQIAEQDPDSACEEIVLEERLSLDSDIQFIMFDNILNSSMSTEDKKAAILSKFRETDTYKNIRDTESLQKAEEVAASITTVIDEQETDLQNMNSTIDRVLDDDTMSILQKKDAIMVAYRSTSVYDYTVNMLSIEEAEQDAVNMANIVDEYDNDSREINNIITQTLADTTLSSDAKKTQIIESYKETNLYKNIVADLGETAANEAAREAASIVDDYDADILEMETLEATIDAILVTDVSTAEKYNQILTAYKDTNLYAHIKDTEGEDAADNAAHEIANTANEYDADVQEQETYNGTVETILADTSLSSDAKKARIIEEYKKTYMYEDIRDSDGIEAADAAAVTEASIVDDYNADILEMETLEATIDAILITDVSTAEKYNQILAAYKDTNLYAYIKDTEGEDAADNAAHEIANTANEYDADVQEQETYNGTVETILADTSLSSDAKKARIIEEYKKTYMYEDIRDSDGIEAANAAAVTEASIVDDYDADILEMETLQATIDAILVTDVSTAEKYNQILAAYKDTNLYAYIKDTEGENAADNAAREIANTANEYDADVQEQETYIGTVETILADTSLTSDAKKARIIEEYKKTYMYEDIKNSDGIEAADTAAVTEATRMVDEHTSYVEEMRSLNEDVDEILMNSDLTPDQKKVAIKTLYKASTTYANIISEEGQPAADRAAEEFANVVDQYEEDATANEAINVFIDSVLAHTYLTSNQKKQKIRDYFLMPTGSMGRDGNNLYTYIRENYGVEDANNMVTEMVGAVDEYYAAIEEELSGEASEKHQDFHAGFDSHFENM